VYYSLFFCFQNALFVWTYQQNQQSSSSVFLSQQTSEQCFQHNKPAKRTGWKKVLGNCESEKCIFLELCFSLKQIKK
jgi:hypothetical protein